MELATCTTEQSLTSGTLDTASTDQTGGEYDDVLANPNTETTPPNVDAKNAETLPIIVSNHLNQVLSPEVISDSPIKPMEKEQCVSNAHMQV